MHHFGGVALVRGESFALGCFESLCFVWLLAFPSLSARLRRALPLSLRSHVLAFDRLRRAVALVLGDRSLLE